MAVATRTMLMLACIAALLPVPLLAQVEREVQSPLSVVSGQVIDHATGQPVVNAEISIRLRQTPAARATRLSAADGTFRFDDVEPGDYLFSVSAFGYAATEDVVEVAAQSDVRVVVSLTASAIELQPLLVETSRRPAFMAGFEQRRAAASRHTGFFTSEEIMALNPKDVPDIFRNVPGATLAPGMVGPDVLLVEGSIAVSRRCVPNLFINGFIAGDSMPYSEIYELEDIAAVELYTLAHDVPQQFRVSRSGQDMYFPCGALVIWLKDGAEANLPPTWKRLLGGGIAAAAAVLLLLLVR